MWVWLCAQKWHPDKQKAQDSTTSRFQDINEAYQGMYVSVYVFVFRVRDKDAIVVYSVGDSILIRNKAILFYTS